MVVRAREERENKMSYGYGHYSAVNAPRLSSYEEAKRWHDRTPPIRGHKDKVRPLGARRYHQRASIHVLDDERVSLRYINKPFIEWFPNNTFVVHKPVYYSAYAVEDLCGFAPMGMSFLWVGCRMFICFMENGEQRKYELTDDREYVFSVTGPRSYLLQDKPKAFRFVRRRNALDKLVNERYGAFLDWVTVVNEVSNKYEEKDADAAHAQLREAAGVPSELDYKRLHKYKESVYTDENMWQEARFADSVPFIRKNERPMVFHTESCAVLDRWLIGTPEEWVKALHVIAKRAGRYWWSRGATADSRWTISTVAIRKCVADIASHLFFEDLFTTELLADGEVPPRTNCNYANAAELKDISNLLRNVPLTV